MKYLLWGMLLIGGLWGWSEQTCAAGRQIETFAPRAASISSHAEPAPLATAADRDLRISGLRAVIGMNTVHLDWQPPPRPVYTQIEIWRAAVDDLQQAKRIGSSRGTRYLDAAATTDGKPGYYWVRGISAAGVEGNFNANQGVPATPAQLLAALANPLPPHRP